MFEPHRAFYCIAELEITFGQGQVKLGAINREMLSIVILRDLLIIIQS